MKPKPPIFLVSLAVLIGLACTYAGRTLHFVFEADDLRFLWWAYENRLTPWEAFTNEPLFGAYYRPVISLVWWLHTMLFGVSDYWHHIALSGWWILVLVLFALLIRKLHGDVSSVCSVVVLLASYAAVHPLVWKSWLTVLVSVSLELGALLLLVRGLHTRRMVWLVGWFVCANVAFLAKESSMVVLPVASLGLLLVYTRGWGIVRGVAAAAIAISAGCFLYTSLGMQALHLHATTGVEFQRDWLPGAGFFADTILTSWWMQAAFAALLMLKLIQRRGWYRWIMAAGLLLAGGAAVVFMQLGIHERQACAIALSLASITLLASPVWKLWVVPVAWLLVSFLPIPVVNVLLPSYAFHAALAFAWIVGVLAGTGILRALAYMRHRPMQLQWRAWSLLTIFPLLMVPGMVWVNHSQLATWVRYADGVYHTPERINRKTMLYDLAMRAYMGSIVIDIGETVSTEAYVALAMPERFGVSVVTDREPTHRHRLEAYTESIYALYPSEEALRIWIDSPLLPSARVMDDPYFNPNAFEAHVISSCDTVENWQTTGTMNVTGFPIGVNATHLNFIFADDNARCSIALNADTLSVEADGARITLWMQTRRWDGVERVEARMQLGEMLYTWDEVSITKWKGSGDWARIVMRMDEAVVSEEADTVSDALEFIIHRSQTFSGAPIHVGIEEVRFYHRK